MLYRLVTSDVSNTVRNIWKKLESYAVLKENHSNRSGNREKSSYKYIGNQRSKKNKSEENLAWKLTHQVQMLTISDLITSFLDILALKLEFF